MTRCPDLTAWEELVRGRRDGEGAAELQTHLATCGDCRAAYENVCRNDRLLDSMRVAWREEPGAGLVGSAPIGMKIGRYEVTGYLGAGGMATVYRATQEQPHRTVALKLMKLSFPSRAAVRRFEHEAELLGRLHHQGIAHVYEAGVDEVAGQPQPFFAMELVDGEKLTDYAAKRNLGARQRLELIARIGDAVHYAHQKGIIHRDLKPSNILVSEDRSAESAAGGLGWGVGQPKILDFGVARATDVDVQATTLRTEIGQLVGTIPYMSPEQAAGDPKELDVRSDVYSLSVVCYELLTGRLPYAVRDKTVLEAVRAIQEDDATRLSMVNRGFRGDLETILAKALEKDKERRYPAMSAFVADIRRYLRNEPIAARPPSVSYQLTKFARRNRALVGGVASVFVVLLFGFVGTGYGLIRAMAERNHAREAERVAQARRAEAETVIDLLTDMLGSADPHRVKGADYTVRQLLDDFSRGLGDRLEDQPEVKATIHSTIGNAYRGLGVREQTALHLKTALDLRRQIQGAEHPDVAQSLHDYAWYHHDNADYPAAEQALRDSLDMRRRLLGNEHVDVAASLDGLGDILRHVDRFDEAESLAREALAMRRRLLPPDHPDVAESLKNLGRALRAKNQFEESESALREALAILQKLHGEHPTIATCQQELGRLLQMKGDYVHAIPVYREALAMARKVLGENHHDVGTTMTYLGESLTETAEYAAAEPLLREGLARGRAVHGDIHSCVAWQQNALAIMLRHSSRSTEAEALFRQVLDMYRGLEGEEGTLTNLLRVNLADVLVVQGQLAEAERLAREALPRHRGRLGNHHRHTSDAARVLGLVLVREGNPVEAEPLLQESVATLRQAVSEPPWRVARAESVLGEGLVALRRFDEAEPLLIQAHATLLAEKGATFSETGAALDRLVVLYEAWGKPDQAAQWRDRPPSEASTANVP